MSLSRIHVGILMSQNTFKPNRYSVVSEYPLREKNSISRNLTQHLRKTFPSSAHSLHSSERRIWSDSPRSICVSNLNPRKRGQQFILTNVRSKLNPKRIDQKLIEDWLENNSFIDSAVWGNVVAFEKQTQFGETEWVRLNCEQFFEARFRPISYVFPLSCFLLSMCLSSFDSFPFFSYMFLEISSASSLFDECSEFSKFR